MLTVIWPSTGTSNVNQSWSQPSSSCCPASIGLASDEELLGSNSSSWPSRDCGASTGAGSFQADARSGSVADLTWAALSTGGTQASPLPSAALARPAPTSSTRLDMLQRRPRAAALVLPAITALPFMTFPPALCDGGIALAIRGYSQGGHEPFTAKPRVRATAGTWPRGRWLEESHDLVSCYHTVVYARMGVRRRGMAGEHAGRRRGRWPIRARRNSCRPPLMPAPKELFRHSAQSGLPGTFAPPRQIWNTPKSSWSTSPSPLKSPSSGLSLARSGPLIAVCS